MRLWIDDSGEKEYGPKTSRFFVYCGVAVAKEDEERVCQAFGDLKNWHFYPHRDVEAKSNWLRIPNERERRYKVPYGISDAGLDSFTQVFYKWLLDQPVTLLAAVIDKHLMLERYGDKAYYASATAYQLLLQRYQFFLQDKGRREGELVLDDMMGRTPKGNPHRKLLLEQHEKLKRHGCNLTGTRFERIAGWIRFGGSHHHPLLQVADLCAYNVHRQFRQYFAEWDRTTPIDQLPLYEGFDLISSKFRMSPTRVVEGFGIVKFPRNRPPGHQSKWVFGGP
ncbi:hypothetical protein D3C87_1331500 [compost metagenome]